MKPALVSLPGSCQVALGKLTFALLAMAELSHFFVFAFRLLGEGPCNQHSSGTGSCEKPAHRRETGTPFSEKPPHFGETGTREKPALVRNRHTVAKPANPAHFGETGTREPSQELPSSSGEVDICLSCNGAAIAFFCFCVFGFLVNGVESSTHLEPALVRNRHTVVKPAHLTR